MPTRSIDVTTLTALDVSPSVVPMLDRPSPRKVIEEALTVTCIRLHLSAAQTDLVIDAAIASRYDGRVSTAKAISDGTKAAYGVARLNLPKEIA
jgi:hypothetical protein